LTAPSAGATRGVSSLVVRDELLTEWPVDEAMAAGSVAGAGEDGRLRPPEPAPARAKRAPLSA
jgi:hypothetical protein